MEPASIKNSPKHPSEPIARSHRWRLALAWLGAFLPAWYILGVILLNRPSVPFHDSWAFVKQYQDWSQGKIGAEHLLVLHNDHPTAVGKFIYFVVLHFLKGQVGLLPFLAWGLSLGLSLGVLRLARPCWRESALQGAGVMFLANLVIFSGGQGHTWIWDFVFQNFIPGCLLVWGLVLLRPEVPSWKRLVGALLLSLMAVFTFATGLFVGLLLVPMLWGHVAPWGRKRQWITVAAWLLVLGLAVALAFHYPTPHGEVAAGEGDADGELSRVQDFLQRPLAFGQYFLILLGLGFGQGTPMEPSQLCAAVGAGLLGIFGFCLWRLWRLRDAGLWREVMPWLALCGYGGINAALITIGRLGATMESALAHRYLTFTLCFTLGLLFLGLRLRQHSPWLGRWSRWVVAVALPLQMVTWSSGLNILRVTARQMDQEKYALCFAKVLPLDRSLVWQDEERRTAELAQFLKAGQRLRGVEFLSSLEMAPIKSQRELNPKFATFEVTKRLSDGHLLAGGTCGLDKSWQETPDLVLVSAERAGEPEVIIGVAVPQLPDNFLERELYRRMYKAHYFRWELPLDPAKLTGGKPITLRAYGFDGEKRRASAMAQRITLAEGTGTQLREIN